MRFGAAALAALAALAVSAVAAARPATRVGTAGVTVRLPAGWHAWLPPGVPTSGVIDPRTRVVAVSAPFSFAATGCQVAAYAFPSTAVAVVVVEWVSLGRDDRWLPRPARFTAANLPLRRRPRSIASQDREARSSSPSAGGASVPISSRADARARSSSHVRARSSTR